MSNPYHVQWRPNYLVVSWYCQNHHQPLCPPEIISIITSFYSLWRQSHFTKDDLKQIIDLSDNLHIRRKLDTIYVSGYPIKLTLDISCEQDDGTETLPQDNRYFEFNVVLPNNVEMIGGHFGSVIDGEASIQYRRLEKEEGFGEEAIVADHHYEIPWFEVQREAHKDDLQRMDGLFIDYYCDIAQIQFNDTEERVRGDIDLFPSLSEKVELQWKIESNEMENGLCIENRSLWHLGWIFKLTRYEGLGDDILHLEPVNLWRSLDQSSLGVEFEVNYDHDIKGRERVECIDLNSSRRYMRIPIDRNEQDALVLDIKLEVCDPEKEFVWSDWDGFRKKREPRFRGYCWW